MNESLYGSLPACQRLQAAGIKIETEVSWIWISKTEKRRVLSMYKTDDYLPAPSMGEAWIELPERWNGMTIMMGKEGIITIVGYDSHGPCTIRANINPVDALIDLRIWLEQQKGNI